MTTTQACFNLTLDVLCARDLTKADAYSGAANAYVAVFLGSRRIGTTGIVKRSLNPEWNTEFSMPILDLEAELVLKVFHNRYGRDRSLGVVRVRLTTLQQHGTSEDAQHLESILMSDVEGIEARGVLELNVKLTQDKEMFQIIDSVGHAGRADAAAAAKAKAREAGLIDEWSSDASELELMAEADRAEISRRMLLRYATTDLFDKEFRDTALFRKDIYQTDLAVDVLDDCAGLVSEQVDMGADESKVLKYHSDFNTCTWLHLSSGRSHPTYPFEAGPAKSSGYKFKLRLEVTGGYHTLSFKSRFSYWSCLLRLRAVSCQWDRESAAEDGEKVAEEEEEEWMEKPVGGWQNGYSFPCHVSIGSQPGISNKAILSALGAEVAAKCSFSNSRPNAMQVTTLDTVPRTFVLSLSGLIGAVLNADFTMPAEYDLKLDLLEGEVEKGQAKSDRALGGTMKSKVRDHLKAVKEVTCRLKNKALNNTKAKMESAMVKTQAALTRRKVLKAIPETHAGAGAGAGVEDAAATVGAGDGDVTDKSSDSTIPYLTAVEVLKDDPESLITADAAAVEEVVVAAADVALMGVGGTGSGSGTDAVQAAVKVAMEQVAAEVGISDADLSFSVRAGLGRFMQAHGEGEYDHEEGRGGGGGNAQTTKRLCRTYGTSAITQNIFDLNNVGRVLNHMGTNVVGGVMGGVVGGVVGGLGTGLDALNNMGKSLGIDALGVGKSVGKSVVKGLGFEGSGAGAGQAEKDKGDQGRHSSISQKIDGLYVTVKGPDTPAFMSSSKGGTQPSWNESANLTVSYGQLTGRTRDEICIRLWDASVFSNGLPTLIGEKNVPIRGLFQNPVSAESAGAFHDIVSVGTSYLSDHSLCERTTLRLTLSELTDLYPSKSGGGAEGGAMLRSVYARARLVRWNGDSQERTLSNWKNSPPRDGDVMSVRWPQSGNGSVSFEFSAADGLDWADMVCLEVLDVTNAMGNVAINNSINIASVGEEVVAQTFISVADFTTASRDVEYTLHPGNDAWLEEGYRFADLATMVVGLKKVITEPLTPASRANILVNTRLSNHSVYNTYWPCTAVLSGALDLADEPYSEDLLLFPAHNCLVLINLQDHLSSSMPLRQFMFSIKERITTTTSTDQQRSSAGAGASKRKSDSSSSSSSSSTKATQDRDFEVLVFENQSRRTPFHQWERPPSARAALSDETGSCIFPFENIADAYLSEGWEWSSEWVVDKEFAAGDENGWCYGMSFESIMAGFRRGLMAKTHDNFRVTRRRRWKRGVRKISKKRSSNATAASTDAAGDVSSEKLRSVQSRSAVSETPSQSSSGSLGDDNPTRTKLREKDPDAVFETCSERGYDLRGPIHVPWQHVQRVGVVSATVLAVHLVVHRFTGGRTGAESYAKVDGVVFIRKCPAYSLKTLIDERMQLYDTREGIRAILNDGKLSRSGQISNEMSSASELVRDLDETVQVLTKEFDDLTAQEEERQDAARGLFAVSVSEEAMAAGGGGGGSKSSTSGAISPVHVIVEKKAERDCTRLGGVLRIGDLWDDEESGVNVDDIILDTVNANAASQARSLTAAAAGSLRNRAASARSMFGSAVTSAMSMHQHFSSKRRRGGLSDFAATSSGPYSFNQAGSVGSGSEVGVSSRGGSVNARSDGHSVDTGSVAATAGVYPAMPRILSHMVHTSADGVAVVEMSGLVDAEATTAYTDESLLRCHMLLYREQVQSHNGSNSLMHAQSRPLELKRMLVPSVAEMNQLHTAGFISNGQELDSVGVLSNSETQRKLYLARGKSRLHMYMCVLLGFGLKGAHSYDVDEVRGIADFDIARARSLEIAAADCGTSVNAASEAIFSLVQIAEYRVRETVLCGWYRRGGQLEACLKAMINMYYSNIVGMLGRFFDVSTLDNEVRGLESKIKLLNFVIDQDEKFAHAQTRALHPFRLRVSPLPVLSRCLSFGKLVSWYGDVVRQEMRSFIGSTIDVWRRGAATNREEGCSAFEAPLPWEPVRRAGDSGSFISMIPEDCVEALSQYAMFARPSPSVADSQHDLLMRLDRALADALVGSISYLAHMQLEMVRAYDWAQLLAPQLEVEEAERTKGRSKRSSFLASMGFTLRVGGRSSRKKGTSVSEDRMKRRAELMAKFADAKRDEGELAQIDEHIPFLASVANDCVRLMTNRSIEGFVEKLLGVTKEEHELFFGGVDGVATVNEHEHAAALLQNGGSGVQTTAEVEKLAIPAYTALGDLINNALHSLSRVLFMSEAVRSALSGGYIVTLDAVAVTETKAAAAAAAAAAGTGTKASGRRFTFFGGRSSGKDASPTVYTSLSAVWKASVVKGMESPIKLVLDEALEGIEYAAGMLEPLALAQLVYICADKLALLHYLVLVEQHDSSVPFNKTLCDAYGASVVMFTERFHTVLEYLPPSKQEFAWQRMKHTFGPLNAAAALLVSPLQGAELVLGIQGLFERSEVLRYADVVALGRMARTVTAIRLSREKAEAVENDGAVEYEDHNLWVAAAEQIASSSVRAMYYDAENRRMDGTLCAELEPTGAILAPRKPLLRLAFGPICDDFVVADVENIRAPCKADSPAYSLTAMEVLQGSEKNVAQYIARFTAEESQRNPKRGATGGVARRCSATLSSADLSRGTSLAPVGSSSSSVSTAAIAPPYSSTSDGSGQTIVVAGLAATHLLHMGTLTPKVFVKLALVPCVSRFIDFTDGSVHWLKSSSQANVYDMRKVTWDADRDVFTLQAPDSLQSLDLVIGLFHKRIYGGSQLICHARANLGFLQISSIDNRPLKTVLNVDDAKVAAAVEKEDAAFPDYLKASTIVLSVKLQDASSSLGTITE